MRFLLILLLAGCASPGVGTRRLTDATLWYPTDARGTEHVENAFVTTALPDANLPDGTHGLVLLSHGNGGNPAGLAWLAERLAARGFVVAAPLHAGTNFRDVTPKETYAFWKRTAHLTRVLDTILADAELGPRIDRARISAVGFSLGGSTVLLLAGADYDPERFEARCEGIDCRFRAAPTPYAPPANDARIRRFVAIAPGFGAGFVPKSLPNLLLIASDEDEQAPLATNAGALGVPPAIVKHAGHYSFLGRCGKKISLPFCNDRGRPREEVHDEVARLIQRFLEQDDGR